MLIKFREFGTSLGTREMGNELRIKIEEKFDIEDKIEFDLTGIDVISHSYADEVFGKLIKRYGIASFKNKTSFIKPNDFVASVIINVLNESIQQWVSSHYNIINIDSHIRELVGN